VGLPTDEHASTLDGAIRYSGDSREVDIRVSIVPTLDGEKTVLRLLARYVGGLSYRQLGLNSM